jgi:hypothetical protein
MTTAQEPGFAFEVQGDARWVQVPHPLVGDAGVWAAEVVQEGLRVRGVTEDEAVRMLYTQSLAGVAETISGRERPGAELVGAYLLVPGDDLVPVTAAELEVVACDPALGVDGFAEGLVLPADQRFGDPGTDTIQTRNGEAVRIEQLAIREATAAAAADGDQDQTVATLVAYVWPGPVAGSVVLLHAYFGSPVDAELCREPLDDLAGSLMVTEVAA